MYKKASLTLFKDGTLYLEDKDKPPVSSIKDRTHRVIQGDTLFSISYLYYKSHEQWDIIGKANKITNPFDLSLGSILIIPFYGK
jgi:nucleoid-associated protein YgaU